MITQHNNVINFPGEAIADVEHDAARWLARITSGSLTLGELAEFEFWRVASADHDRVYRELEAVWDGLSANAVARHWNLNDNFDTHMPQNFVRWATRLGQMAAALLCLAMLSQYLTNWRYDFHTAPGEIRKIALADGSKVFMKGDTALNVDVSNTGARSVELARGEAFFEVNHDASRPFTVDVGSGTVRDIGTAFSIARNGKAVAVAVEQGIVGIDAAGQSDRLFKGQQIGFDLYAMGAKSQIDTAAISAWRRNLYVADGKRLGDVLSDLGEYYPHRIVMMNPELASRRVNVVIQLDNIDDWLNALNDTAGVSVRRYGPITIVGAR